MSAIGRGVTSTWAVAAKGVGATTRTVSKAKDIEHGHRRDGIALGLIAVSVIVAAAVWFSAGGPIGEWIEIAVRAVVGDAGYIVPALGVAIAVVLMRSEPNPEIRPRLVLGSILLSLPILGLWHMAAGFPTDAEGRATGGGFVGYVAGGPIVDGLTVWLAVPLLFLAGLFGVLLLTGTPFETSRLNCARCSVPTAAVTSTESTTPPISERISATRDTATTPTSTATPSTRQARATRTTITRPRSTYRSRSRARAGGQRGPRLRPRSSILRRRRRPPRPPRRHLDQRQLLGLWRSL